MKAASAGMQAHLAGDALTLATLWRVTRVDGALFTFTDHDRDIVYGGDTYRAALGYRRAAVSSGADLAVDETELEGLLDAASITEADLRAGRWDGAEVRIFLVNWANLANGEIKVRRGTLGEVTLRDDGSYRAELRGLAQRLQAPIGSLYQPECRADLGDAKCKIPLRPPVRQSSAAYALGAFMRVGVSGPIATTYDEGGAIWECTTAGTAAASDPGGWAGSGPITDGSVVWAKRTAWTRPATIATVSSSVSYVLTADDIGTYADGWFDGGVAIWETGVNAGVAREVLSWTQASRALLLFAPPPLTPEPTDILRIQPGCDKRWSTCGTRFANRLNFRGEPHVPGAAGLLPA
jgi:uncharacterized phage protein (TIGR02218 family)